MTTYVESSFLVSLHVTDQHSPKADGYVEAAAGPLQITPLCVFEFVNALQLRVFRKQLSADEAGRVYHDLELQIARGTYSLAPLPPAVFTRARQLAQRHTAELGTRSLDVLHVAAALALGAEAIASFDRSVRALAQAAGLAAIPD